jgi:FkbM family methyltransferase
MEAMMLRGVHSALAALTRAYMRYAPIAAGKPVLWSRLIDPYFAWYHRPFVARTVFGMKMRGDSADIIGQYIYYFGLWEPDITAWVRRRLARGDVFLDVGANIGYYSLLASRMVGPHGSVVAVEASPTTFRVLLDNVAMNGVANVRALNLAASEHPGRVKLYRGSEYHSGLATVVEERGFELGAEVEAEVPAAPLNSILSAEEMRRLRLAKIDVEGAEAQVVAGMGSLIERGRPDLEIIIEIDPVRLERQGTSAEAVLAPFFRAGYHAYVLANDYSPYAYMRRNPNPRAARLHRPLKDYADVALSREDAELL